MLGRRGEPHPELLQQLGMPSFRQRLPWLGGDLQTLRDTLRPVRLPSDRGEAIEIAVPALPSGMAGSGHLLALFDRPQNTRQARGLVLLLHGLGGSSRREGLRRMACALQTAGFAVLRLNLRGADPGRHLSAGTYAAECNSDLGPVLLRARQLCDQLGREGVASRGAVPLLGAGISLGGTMLLNACLEPSHARAPGQAVLDGLVCTSSPLDLAACSASIERPRNRVYQRWLLQRLIRQTLADPFGVTVQEREVLNGEKGQSPPATIREFDAAITAPRWGYGDVDAYYAGASPLIALLENPSRLPPTLLLQALDDPWVPAEAAQQLAANMSPSSEQRIQVLLTPHGGHNGFHAIGGCWGDQVVARWLSKFGA